MENVMKYKTSERVFVKTNDIAYLECTIVGYTLYQGKTTYRLFNPTNEELFDAEEDNILKMDNFKIVNGVLN
jgi:hypothetical protein